MMPPARSSWVSLHLLYDQNICHKLSNRSVFPPVWTFMCWPFACLYWKKNNNFKSIYDKQQRLYRTHTSCRRRVVSWDKDSQGWFMWQDHIRSYYAVRYANVTRYCCYCCKKNKSHVDICCHWTIVIPFVMNHFHTVTKTHPELSTASTPSGCYFVTWQGWSIGWDWGALSAKIKTQQQCLFPENHASSLVSRRETAHDKVRIILSNRVMILGMWHSIKLTVFGTLSVGDIFADDVANTLATHNITIWSDA